MSPRLSTPPLSVCLLAYNHGTLLPEVVRSVLNQEFTDFELILSDDCSTDDTWERIQALAATDNRIVPMRTPKNLGMAAHSNFVFQHCQAPYIALLHHDDLCEPNLLKRWFEVMSKYPDVGFVSNAYRGFNTGVLHQVSLDEHNDGKQLLRDVLLGRFHSPFRGTALIRRSAWDQVGGMREQFGLMADVDLWLRLAAQFAVGYVREPLIIVRHDRPDDYPAEYTSFSWRRLRLAYEIYGDNRRRFYGTETWPAHARSLHYRVRVSRQITYWLTYACVKRRRDILTTSTEVECEYELPPTRWLRQSLATLLRYLPVASTRRHVASTPNN